MEGYISQIKDIIFSGRNLSENFREILKIMDKLIIREDARYYHRAESSFNGGCLIIPGLIIQFKHKLNCETDEIQNINLTFVFGDMAVDFEETNPNIPQRGEPYHIFIIDDRIRNIITKETLADPFKNLFYLLTANTESTLTLKEFNTRYRLTKSARV
jgi:hypothetical protein